MFGKRTDAPPTEQKARPPAKPQPVTKPSAPKTPEANPEARTAVKPKAAPPKKKAPETVTKIDRQAADIAVLRKDEKRRIPPDIDYSQVGSLSNEIREKLDRVRPETISQAQRIEGMTPSAILAVLSYLNKKAKSRPELKQAQGA